MTDELRAFILNPPPGSALARARDFGIDLTQLVENLARTPEMRLHRAEQNFQAAALLRNMREHGKRT